MLDEVYAVVRAGGADQDGHNVMVFRDLPGGGVDVEVGVQAARPFEVTGSVMASELPAGTVVVAVHRGPYGRLGSTHEAIHRWCAHEQLTLAGPRWEIYGDPTPDEDALETEIVYLLA